jgi:hypothetical protein
VLKVVLDPKFLYQFIIKHHPKLRSVPVSIQILRVICGSSFGGLEVPCWPFVLKFTGSHLDEAVGILVRKSKAVGPMS